MGGNYTEETVEKKMRAMSLVNKVVETDNRSLLLPNTGPSSSWERFDEEELERFRKYAHQLDPFRYLV